LQTPLRAQPFRIVAGRDQQLAIFFDAQAVELDQLCAT